MRHFLINNSFDLTVHSEWLDYRRPVLHFYNDYSFIRDIEKLVLFDQVIIKLNKADEVWSSQNCAFFINHLSWDTDYFGVDSYRIAGCLFGALDPQMFLNEVKLFFEEFYSEHPNCKIVAELPSEDFDLIQALSYSGLRLIEARLIHYKYPLKHLGHVGFRKATAADGEKLGRVAAKMRNPADRYHADLLFDNVKADQYLYTYAKACVDGFTDTVIVPDEHGVASNAFIAINYRKTDWEWNSWKPSQIVLAAVDSESNKGWYKKLVIASINHVLDEGAGCLFNTTQITNKVVIHTLESLEFRLGATKMVFSN